MPRYDYRCKACGNTFELVRPFAQSGEDATCPACQGTASRLIANTYTVFSKSYTGWATRIQGTDWPWRTPGPQFTPAEDELAEEQEEPSEAASGEDKPVNPPSLARYATVFDSKLGLETKVEPVEPAPKEEKPLNPPSLERYADLCDYKLGSGAKDESSSSEGK